MGIRLLSSFLDLAGVIWFLEQLLNVAELVSFVGSFD